MTYVYYDAGCTGWYTRMGRYADVFDAEIYAKELVRRLGGQCKLRGADAGVHAQLGDVGALETWTDGRGAFAGYRCAFDVHRHEWWGKRNQADDSQQLQVHDEQ